MVLALASRARRALAKAAVTAFGLNDWFGGIFRSNGESWPGQWQSATIIECTENLFRFASVYACVALISNDVAKLRPRLMRRAPDGIWDEVAEAENSPFSRVLRRPNRYQTWAQFIQQWVVSKLTHGNAYVIKEREGGRGMVRALYVLDARRVLPSVAPDGAVYYQLASDDLAQTGARTVVDASEIIHDRMTPIWHPLIGVSPLYASGIAATVGIRIQRNSENFFKNMSRPSGQLTAPGRISDELVARLKDDFEKRFRGENLGRIFVSGEGLKFEAIPPIPAHDAQLAEQHKISVEEVARAFGVPLYKISAGAYPNLTSVGAINQDYYDHALQIHLTSIEQCLNEGLELPVGMKLDIDENGIMRMDPLGRAEVTGKEIGAGYLAPNEARARGNYHAVRGGEYPFLQQQNYPLPELQDLHEDERKQRKAAAQAPAPAPAAAPAEQAVDEEIDDDTKALADSLIRRFTEAPVALAD